MTNSLKQLGVLLLALAIAACSSNKEKENTDPVPLPSIQESRFLETLWKTKVGDIDTARYAMLRPAISDSNIYVADSDGRVMALNRFDGERVWRVDLGQDIGGGVGYGDGVVVVASYNGEVIGVDSGNGAVLWRAQLSSEVLSAPAVASGIVVVQTLDGKVLGLQAQSGTVEWRYAANMPVLTLRGTSSPVVSADTVIAALDNGKLVGLGLYDGVLRWEQRVAVAQGTSELERVIDIDGVPVVRGDLVFAASYQGRVAALSRDGGRGLWARDASTHHSVAVGAGNVYLSGADGTVSAFNVRDGQVLWSNDQLLRRQLSGPAFLDDTIVVGDLDGYLHLLDPVSGRLLGREKVGGDPLRIPLQAESGVLYVLGDDGKLTALRVVTSG
ncbi:outer membrane protein assembly factor BamB [Biformimicrobium ophioploci]|uniref:Outer membrane protein assembly factor BamB n=1 Tax=Biformimicrobium ophioploci TaxID=3036711 RepID=A0ABQ6LZ82_9GAMM|nr:outer membrane protein assembly factor BamB [Microbulbifer sp. NKW57]GMG87400.1 outer membrane protein assembly factor BamB [Microbulbifer sp. NKW57]